MTSTQSYQNNNLNIISQLGISPKVRDLILEEYPEIIPDIIDSLDKQPFNDLEEILSSSYLIEGVTFIHSQKGESTYYLPCDSDSPPGDYSEYYLNEQLVFMEVLGEVVIDRLTPSLKTKFREFLQQTD